MKKPRPFSLRPIYVDERRELLAEVEQRARRELGKETKEQPQSNRLHEAFARQRRQTATTGTVNWMVLPMALLLIIMMVVIWKFLL